MGSPRHSPSRRTSWRSYRRLKFRHASSSRSRAAARNSSGDIVASICLKLSIIFRYTSVYNQTHPLEHINPTAVAASPRTTLPMTYRLKAPQRPIVARESASFEKVENVVKPPQRPTVSASCRLSLQPILEPNPPRRPIAKLPMTLIATVAQGKKHDDKMSPIAYRNIR